MRDAVLGGRFRVVVAAVFVAATLGVLSVLWVLRPPEPGAPTRKARRIVAALQAMPSSPLQPADAPAPPAAPRATRELPVVAEHRSARVTLPGHATEPLRLEETATGMAIAIQPRGVRDVAAQSADGYYVYPNAHASGGTLLHRAAEDGAEDFVSFETRPAVPEVVYDLKLDKGVSGLRLIEGTLELLDANGAPRLRAAPPFIASADGARIDATLAVEGCAVDNDPAGPWGRAVTAPGAGTCTLRVRWPDEAVEYPAILDPKWTTTGNLTVARQDHNLITLPLTGKVLAVGGRSSPASTTGLASAEIFDKSTGTWSVTGSMSGGRWSASATLLNSSSNGTTSQRVLVTGGINGTTSLNTAQLYNQTAGTWAAAGNLNAPRHLHTATLLADGRVLVAGGQNGTTVLQSAALYSPVSGSGSWAATTGPIPPPGWRFGTATLIQTSNNQLNNKVLLAGGNDGTHSLSSVFLFDPAQSAFSTLAPMPSAREGGRAVVVSGGRLLIAGGKNGTTTLASAVVFDPGFGPGSWSTTGSMTSARWGHATNLLPTSVNSTGQVIVSGGSNGTSTLSSTEIWNGSTWAVDGAMVAPVQQHASVSLGTSILIAGGSISNGGTTVRAAELYDPSLGLTCTSGSQCASGFCVNGVCCDTACNAGCGACNLPTKVGTCSPVAAGSTCRPSTGACDAAETCNGATLACPADGFAPATTVCRSAAGPCDVAENCTGTSATCPTDGFLPSTTTCRPAAGPCDVAENCSGSAATCPTNQFVAATTVCRPETGACDAAELCTGSSATCPADGLAAAGTPCRASQGICDAVETCTGSSSSCPADQLAVAGTPCRPSSGACDPTEACTGTSLACPPDVSTCGAQSQTFDISITLPRNLQPRQVLLATSNSLDLEQNINLSGPTRPVVAEMGTGGTVVRTGASNQDLYSVGNVQLDGAQVSGKVFGEGTVQLINGASVAGGITRGPIGRRTITIMSLTFPAKDGGSLDVAQNTTVNLLQTGAYRDVSVKTGATLKLSGGPYTFNSLITEPGSTVLVDDSVAPLELGIRSTFIHRGTFVATSGSSARTLIIYVGTNETFVEAGLAASVIAPNAQLTLGSSPNITHRGSFFARNILVRPGTRLVHVPSEAIDLPLIGVAVPPGGREPIPGYDPGSLVCTAGLILGAQATDANGVVFRQNITYPTNTLPTTGPGCRVAIQFCDDNEQVVAAPPEADFNSTVPTNSSCPAAGIPGAQCGIDPATAGGPCTTDADCPGAICAAQCTTAACTHTDRRCGNYYASCGGIPAEPTNCDPRVFRQCADPKAVGTVTRDEAADQVDLVTEAPPDILVPEEKKLIPLPYVTLQGGFCASPALQPPTDLRQDKGDGMTMGNDQWGFFIEPEVSSLFSISKKEIKEQSLQVGARVGAAAGAKVFGEKITALKATVDFDLQDCGKAIGLDLRLFGDSIASLDTEDGLKTGLGNLDDFGNTKKTKDADNRDCLDKFKQRDDKSEDLKKLVYSARNAKDFYLDSGTSKELCQRTNTQLNKNFDCDNPDLVGEIGVPNAWIEEYNAAGRDYGKTKKAFETSRDKTSGSVQIGLFDKRHQYHMNIFQTTFPIGPVTVTIVVDGFGEWHFSGAIQLGASYGGSLLDLAGEALLPFSSLFGAPADIKVVGGPIITPGASVGVIVFAGAGIPGVSIGLEGALEILGLSVPLDARLAAARVTEPDTRDVNNSVFAGDPFDGMDPTTTQHWKYGWAAGARLVINGLNGQLDGVVRVRLLFVRKTFRRNITKWAGFKTVIPIIAASGGIGNDDDPIVATDDFGVYADRIAHTNVIPLDTTALIGNPDPNAHYPTVLGQEPCIIVE